LEHLRGGDRLPRGPWATKMAGIDELQLIRRIARNDREAFAEVYDRYRPRLVRFVMRLMRRPELAEEVVNDTMIVVWQMAGRFRGASRVSTWILGIAYRTTLKRLRRISTRAEDSLDEEIPATDGATPDIALSREQWRERIQRALQQLSPEQRAVVELTFYEGCSYREVAEIVGCPENTVKTRMFHARKRLRRLLQNPFAGKRQTRRQHDPW
jgi:RNA polymerase sigma factor (sigma-70 family)